MARVGRSHRQHRRPLAQDVAAEAPAERGVVRVPWVASACAGPDRIAAHPLLRRLSGSEEALVALCRSAQHRAFRVGEPLCRQNDRAASVFLVLRGACSVRTIHARASVVAEGEEAPQRGKTLVAIGEVRAAAFFGSEAILESPHAPRRPRRRKGCGERREPARVAFVVLAPELSVSAHTASTDMASSPAPCSIRSVTVSAVASTLSTMRPSSRLVVTGLPSTTALSSWEGFVTVCASTPCSYLDHKLWFRGPPGKPCTPAWAPDGGGAPPAFKPSSPSWS